MRTDSYEIVIGLSVSKDLKKVPMTTRKVIVGRIHNLGLNPRPVGTTKLQGSDDLYRIRYGDYRIIYRIEKARLVVVIIKIGHRKDVYRT
jgi:mRNA interferase RelE/StbE